MMLQSAQNSKQYSFHNAYKRIAHVKRLIVCLLTTNAREDENDKEDLLWYEKSLHFPSSLNSWHNAKMKKKKKMQ